MSTIKKFYGHGKLLLSSEYFILDGAQGLAIPTRFGQHLRASTLSGKSNLLYWVALNQQRHAWLNLVFERDSLTCLNSEGKEALALGHMLQSARKLNPAFLTDEYDCAIETYLEFPNHWGLGSSSTLLYCLSQWAKVDAYALMAATTYGSGYDLACADSSSPLLYCLKEGVPEIQKVAFQPVFRENLFFVHRGQKQSSASGIGHYRARIQNPESCIAQLNELTNAMLHCHSLKDMESIIIQHEDFISFHLNLPKAKEEVLPDYWGAVKSLGAWGGDFLMITNERPISELLKYLHCKGLHVCLGYDDIMLQNPDQT